MTAKPLPVAQPLFGPEEEEAVARVLRSGWVTQGPEIAAFEEEFAAYCGAPHAVAVANCTTALHLALVALGIGSGDEVITVSHSFIATANAVRHAGALPVFVDIRLDDFGLDPAKIEAAITPQTKAILAVHQIGMPCHIAEIAEIARRHDLKLIEDAACAVGSELLRGNHWNRIGQPIGDAACFSFHPRKLLTTGDGGMITVREAALDAKLRLLRQHGMSVNDRQRHHANTVIFEEYLTVGYNARLTDVQAAIGRCQLRRLPELIAQRRILADLYHRSLQGLPLTLPADGDDTRTNWQSYCVLLAPGNDQGAIMQYMLDQGISTRRGVMCAHREPAYQNEPERGALRFPLPQSESVQDRGLILPLYPAMQEDDVRRVADVLGAALGRQQKRKISC